TLRFTLFPYTTLFRSGFASLALSQELRCPGAAGGDTGPLFQWWFDPGRANSFRLYSPGSVKSRKKVMPLSKVLCNLAFASVSSRSEEHTSELQSPDHL